MAYERDPRDTEFRGNPYATDQGSGREYSSSRQYAASGYFDSDGQRGDRGRYDQGGGNQASYGGRDRDLRGYGAGGDRDSRSGGYGGQDYASRDYGDRSYGAREYGHERYDQREQFNRGRGWQDDQNRYGRESYGPDRGYGQSRSDNSRYGRDGGRDYGRQPQGYQYQDRGFLARAGDEVRSWFGDEDAERRRDADQRYDERYASDRDNDYHNWRRGQIDALDRDYHEYRQENRTKFENEFSTWRTARQGQRDSLTKVAEHMDVVGSDGSHVGTVDKIRGDRIILTKNDADAGGRHHSIPSRWIDSVSEKVTLSKTADEAKKAWRDEENSQALFGSSSGSDRSESGRNGGNMQTDRTTGAMGSSRTTTSY